VHVCITSHTDLTVKMCSVSTGLDFSDEAHFWTCDTIIMWHIRYDGIEMLTFHQRNVK